MEDILALVVVLVLIGGAIAIGRIVYRSHKRHKAEQLKQEAQRFQYSPKQWEPLTPKQYADRIYPKDPIVTQTKKRPPTMKTVNKTTSYTSTPMTSSSDDGFLTGMLVGAAIDTIMHSSGTGRSILAEERNAEVSKSESSWGFDDSDSRKSVSSSMDTSSSWSSSDSSSSSSDSGPSSDW